MPQTKLRLRENVVSYLQARPGRKFTAREIACWMMETFPEACREKRENSATINSDPELLQQIIAEIGATRPDIQRKHPQLKTTEGRPRRYYWTEKTDLAEVIDLENETAQSTADLEPNAAASSVYREHDLYALLSSFVWTDNNVLSMRIDERRSSNRKGPQGNKWLYPDVVGMEDITADWHMEVKSCAQQYGDKKTRLWSFEVKLLLNRSNVREAYFQTVSNSSWANFAYLAAAEIEGSDTLKELRMLFALHGVGLIRINPDNPAESELMIPARERDSVDWATCSRLAEENTDFRTFIMRVRQFYQTGDPRIRDWDGQQKG